MTRRVIAGLDASGAPAFVADEVVEPKSISTWPEGAGLRQLWGRNSRPRVPNDGSGNEYDTVFPPRDGFRVSLLRIAPTAPPPEHDPEVVAAEYAEQLPGFFDHTDSGEGGLHATQTLDVVVVVEGEIWLRLGAHAERLLQAGDVVVVNGVLHAWDNRSDEVCAMVAFAVGADSA